MECREETDWGRRLWLFDRLVWTMMRYGIEIGIGRRESMRKLREIFEDAIFLIL